MVASLTKRFGDLDIVEEAAAVVFAAAVLRWPADGVPSDPGGWLTTTATRKAIDRIQRENKRDDKHEQARTVSADDRPTARCQQPVCWALYSFPHCLTRCCAPAPSMETSMTGRSVA